MNSFVCENNYRYATQRLDMKRLGKQRVEVWQMLQALTEQTTMYANHPATLAWKGHERSLARFGLACHDEWISRGYNDTTRDRLYELMQTLPETYDPWWVTDGHWLTIIRSRLIAKNPAWYASYWPELEPMYDKQPYPTFFLGVFATKGQRVEGTEDYDDRNASIGNLYRDWSLYRYGPRVAF